MASGGDEESKQESLARAMPSRGTGYTRLGAMVSHVNRHSEILSLVFNRYPSMSRPTSD